jgi:hypothetical protein
MKVDNAVGSTIVALALSAALFVRVLASLNGLAAAFTELLFAVDADLPKKLNPREAVRFLSCILFSIKLNSTSSSFNA